MKTLLGTAIIIGFCVVSTGAQRGGSSFGGRTPSGSYTRSCSNAQMLGSVLAADCRNQNGVNIRSRLYVRDCAGDISNQSGELRCSSRRTPQGTYSQTCNNCRAVGSTLQCTCRDTRRSNIRTTLDLASCQWNRDITNFDGHLQCD
jgi:hypothetical protein